jgi:hypothetical protein
MRKAERELMIGARIDPSFGPVVIVGDGGKYVESLKDFAAPGDAVRCRGGEAGAARLRIAPAARRRARRSRRRRRRARRGRGRRGRLIAGARGKIASIDLNP